ncbi:MAG: hypothetical protein H0T47_04400 [Planctomycetaceae bacterium]|nr:hypothetical protein [Planctomycetaceae bacterium]
MKSTVFRLVAAVVAVSLLVVIGVLFAIARFDLIPEDYVEPLSVAVEFAEPVPPIEPLPDDIVALRPAIAAKGGYEGLLIRELGRQAVLIAARDEMGLRTRDVLLREILPDADFEKLRALDAHVISPPDGNMFVGIVRSGGAWEDIDFYKIPPGGEDENRIAYVARQAEAASRDELVKRLTGIGFKTRKAAVSSEARSPGKGRFSTYEEPSPKVVERMDLVSQYGAARAWHETIRTHGETPERLAGLVRAYTNLGVLTSHHWSASQKTYQARSLLYAERLLRLTGETSSSLRWRAYARAFLGLPTLALSDMDAADTVADQKDSVPDWCASLRAYAAGDLDEMKRLRSVGDRNTRTVACLLVLNDALLAQWPGRIEEAANALLEVSPANNRAATALLDMYMPLVRPTLTCSGSRGVEDGCGIRVRGTGRARGRGVPTASRSCGRRRAAAS